MVDDRRGIKCRSPPQKKETVLGLEEILKQKVSLDTDIKDFFLIAGWGYFGGHIYLSMSKDSWEKLGVYVNERRNRLSSSEKHKESRFRNCMLMGYGKRFKTIGELKSIIENEGMQIRNLHYKTFAYFNDTLEKYEIEPIKIGGRHTPAILRDLQKYGLEPAKKAY